jgi:hypothetical protein
MPHAFLIRNSVFDTEHSEAEHREVPTPRDPGAPGHLCTYLIFSKVNLCAFALIFIFSPYQH